METLENKTNRAFFKKILDDLNRQLYDFDIRLERLEKRLERIEIVKITETPVEDIPTIDDLHTVRDDLTSRIDDIWKAVKEILKNSEKGS